VLYVCNCIERIWELSRKNLAKSVGTLHVETSKTLKLHLHWLLVDVEVCAQVGGYAYQLEKTNAIENFDPPNQHQ
jgi:hypothetical protein